MPPSANVRSLLTKKQTKKKCLSHSVKTAKTPGHTGRLDRMLLRLSTLAAALADARTSCVHAKSQPKEPPRRHQRKRRIRRSGMSPPCLSRLTSILVGFFSAGPRASGPLQPSGPWKPQDLWPSASSLPPNLENFVSSRRGSHSKEDQTRTFGGPWPWTSATIPRKDPQREKEKRNLWREKEKKARNFGQSSGGAVVRRCGPAGRRSGKKLETFTPASKNENMGT